MRFLLCNHFIQRSLINEAADQGFITLETKKSHTGRPSLIVRKVSKGYPTKRPPLRSTLENCISFRHWRFATCYVLGECGPGLFNFKRRAYVSYQRTFPSARSIEGAKASASRLLRQPHIQAAIQWELAKCFDSETDCNGLHPQTAVEIWDTLHELGSWRANRQ